MPVPLAAIGSAVFSEDRAYRYVLRREWTGGEGQLLVIMLNPSTADESRNDPTIRRCIGFARDAGYRSLAVANLFGLRSTAPGGLLRHPDPVGPENGEWTDRLIAESDAALVAWGAFPFAVERGEATIERLARSDLPMLCLGRTKSGAPRHPLYAAKAGGMLDYL